MGNIQELRCQNCFAPLDVSGSNRGIVRCDFCGTDNAMPSDVRRVQAEDSHVFVAALIRAITDQASMSDINTFCVSLSGRARMRIDFDDLAGDGKPSKARELVLWCRRRGLLQELFDAILDVNPRFELVLS